MQLRHICFRWYSWYDAYSIPLIVPLPSNSHHQDHCNSFSRETRTKPLFVTISGKGDNPKVLYPKQKIPLICCIGCRSSTSILSLHVPTVAGQNQKSIRYGNPKQEIKSQSHRIHERYISLHSPSKSTKCR